MRKDGEIMMSAELTRETLTPLVVETLEDICRDQDLPIVVAVDAETVLFGEGGLLDSLGLVTLIVELEQRIEDRFGVRVALADERALSERRSPYRTVGSLADYAALRARENRRDG